MKFHERLYTLRKNAAMTQNDLAEKLNVSRQAVSRWEMGTAMPDVDNLLAMSELFGVSLDYMLKGREFTASTAQEDGKNAETEESKNGGWLLLPIAAPLIGLSLLLYGWLFEKDILCQIGAWIIAGSFIALVSVMCILFVKSTINRIKKRFVKDGLA